MKKQLTDLSTLELALTRVGEYLDAERTSYAIVVIGGAAMNLLGFVLRPTQDVDILAMSDGTTLSKPSDPLPDTLQEAIMAVAIDMNLDSHWLNTGPALQWQQGLPPGIEKRVEWKSYGGLRVGLAARYDLIFFKLYAAADNGPQSVHYRDLLALHPTAQELENATAWIRTQDPSDGFTQLLEDVLQQFRHDAP